MDNLDGKNFSKDYLRKNYLEIRKNIKNKDIKSKKIIEKIIKTIDYKNAKIIAVYKSLKDEVNTDELIKKALSDGKIVALPKVFGDNMKFYKIESYDEKLKKSKFGVKEPIDKIENYIIREDIDIIIVPGICFDNENNRIGFGKGYYDRYLKNSNIKSIGICFEEQIVTKISSSYNDVKMNLVITDS